MVSEKEYLDNILKEIDPVIKLDDDQRKVVLTDEDYCLVIAGAGAGKTTTVAAKVKCLVEKLNIKPEEILVVSFTNKAVEELRDKIKNQLHIDCPITTFHASGNAILHKQNDEKLNIVQNEKLYFILEDYFNESVLTNEKLVDDLVTFFASYCDAPADEIVDKAILFNKIASSSFTTLRSELGEYEKKIIPSGDKKYVTIQNEQLRSNEEVQIANFLYLNNIEYEYEPKYKFSIEGSIKPYTPDFIIKQGDKEAYIEHFGVTQDGYSNRYSKEELEKYQKAMKDKVALHKQHGTTLICTCSKYNDGRELTEHLREKLEDDGFILTPKDNKEVMKKISDQDGSRYVRKLINLVDRFIGNFKTNGYTVQQFDEWQLSANNVRTKLFLRICKECYLEYERYLNKHNAIDFSDMINKSAILLKESEAVRSQIKFKYIIVDEYQDISRQRFNLVEALHTNSNAKIIAVGDDWQSIYAFSGSDITLFTKFSEIMGYAELLSITKTYRNSQEVIDIAGNFIQKNSSQIRKSLKSPKTITDPVIIYTYDSKLKEKGSSARSGAIYNQAKAVEIAIEQILEYDKQAEKKSSSILLLGRFGFDGKNLERSGLFEYKDSSKVKCLKYPKLNIIFMTAHASKGLGYDNVIVINGKNETYGFPSKIEDDPVLNYVIKRDNTIDAAEERRLFYVAMTRTKNRVYFIAPEQNPSEFLLEIKNDYKNVVLKGEWNEEVSDQNKFKKSCPICGYPLQHKYKEAYGLHLWICTNEPEICDFMTNKLDAGKLAIMKCPDCDGYLIAKSGKSNNYFLACTNYTSDNKGCNKKIWKTDYYKIMGYKE
ncbi:UvrD-helicase domain-containing protein [Treponema sp. Marseille-Q3903]|uniref:UvrD-helicase domain-containing protein n=1 Tax=Treponema sp. Marseille-Q3903 TaxID=2766703 RepID=UPI001651E86A|nr:UvrD-helicase domain-containing protein [Treponema sp. Marseille-Q3903]MBC6713771.1 UvrD-helicase domain-containing protein [Treponema sp. Marseille-Q3903]